MPTPDKEREIWVANGLNDPKTIGSLAKQREDEGFDGCIFGDSQNRYADPFVSMGIAAVSTTHLKLTTGVTNPVTRHPAVMAAAIGSVQAASDGRAVLGISRGDSALAHLGMSPAPLAAYEKYINVLRGYLAGKEVSFDAADAALGGRRRDIRDVEDISVGKRPATSRIQWLPGDLPKVPVDVFATGPKMIEMGARVADRLTFAVGADPERVRWALSLAHEARKSIGLDPEAMSYGAMVALGLDDDLDRARKQVVGTASVMMRFSLMHDKPVGPLDGRNAEVFERVRDSYDMTRHGVRASDQVSAMPDWFIDRHTIVGPSSVCVDRLTELFELGINRLLLPLNSLQEGMKDEIDSTYRRLSREVIPAMA